VTPPQHTALTLPAPAKLNLFLHVTGRRPDGYHTLESLVVPIDRADLITLSLRDDDAVTRTRGAAVLIVGLLTTGRWAQATAARTAASLMSDEAKVPARTP